MLDVISKQDIHCLRSISLIVTMNKSLAKALNHMDADLGASVKKSKNMNKNVNTSQSIVNIARLKLLVTK